MAFAWYLILSIFFLMVTRGEPCTEYGCPGRPQYEPFVPAPPGHTPHCAPPGQTFCETPDHYPRQLIKFLVDKCSFDFNTALQDESREDFNVYSSPPDYNQGYDYPRQDDQLYTQPPIRGQPASEYGPPSNSSRYHSYKYSAPPQAQRNPFLPEVTLKYHQDVPRQIDRAYSQEPISVLEPNQSWLTNRYSRGGKIAPRSYSVNPLLGYAKLKDDRVKRQSDPEVISLCPTQAQYIAPQAALNKQGNWMYVVNLPGQNKYTQFVRSEKCLNDVCNGICSIPEGYRSRCQQQFVQKRLVALEGSGNRLYTDLFWFPHGCTCQIIPNY
ncbi:protein spaetzle 5 isoform X1 [Temnothorax longispinosus]|uniref:protein spaetzle 5 isoform X1 n=1 Tax=Temnothorax longispinosus TaxID=300112 RepID=UPI003A9A1A40